MEDWLSRLQRGESFLTTFFDQVLQNIEWLICSEIVMADHMAIGGLSRGGFIATHLAAREKRFHTLLGFAPLTRLKTLSKSIVDLDSSLLQRMESLNLLSLVPSLLHLRHVRFYIGNRDSLVDTDECYHFIRRLADEAHEKHVRHCHVELFLTPSIGNKGHGTAQHTFEEGAAWIQHHLQRAGER